MQVTNKATTDYATLCQCGCTDAVVVSWAGFIVIKTVVSLEVSCTESVARWTDHCDDLDVAVIIGIALQSTQLHVVSTTQFRGHHKSHINAHDWVCV